MIFDLLENANFSRGLFQCPPNSSTGFFIAPNIILTAAHNIESVAGSRVTSITVIPGKYYENSPFDSIEISGQKECQEIIHTSPKYTFLQFPSRRRKHDFGVIILPKEALEICGKMLSRLMKAMF